MSSKQNQKGSDDLLSGLLGSLLGGDQTSAQPSSTAKPKPSSTAKPKPSSKPKPKPSSTAKPKPSSKPKPKPSSQEEQGGLDMGGLLGSLLGGGASSSSGTGGLDVGGLLGGLLGGGSSSTSAASGSSSPLGPIIDALAKKMGIPPQIAGVVVSMLLSKMAAGQQGKRMSGSTGLNLDELAGALNAPGGAAQSYVQSTGLVQELVQQTGLDAETASRSLTTALNMLGGATGKTS